MPRIVLKTYIDADQQTVFDLARSIDLHQVSRMHHIPLGLYEVDFVILDHIDWPSAVCKNAFGVCPVNFLNSLIKCDWSKKPAANTESKRL